MNIAKIDKNLAVQTSINKSDIVFIDSREAPIKTYGVYFDGTRFRRVPEDVAAATSPGVKDLSVCTAGGRVRFVTKSPYVALKCRFTEVRQMPHMAFVGIHGFDLYADDGSGERYINSFKPPIGIKEGFESVVELGSSKPRLITINFPLYNGLDSLLIGLSADSELNPPPEYDLSLPVVYYGSSITQGGCASRPGMSYQAILSRRLNVDHINLGFSGNARGEKAIVDYMAGLEMSAFVSDYDHNAPTVEHLKATHRPLYEAIRAAHPDIPILFLSKPAYFSDDRTHNVIKETYESALAKGDKNVYFIDGRTLMTDDIKNEGTVDNVHPTDLGFFSMANVIEPVLRKMLRK